MQQSRRQQLVYRMTPLLFLIVCLGSINLLSRWSRQQSLPVVAPTERAQPGTKVGAVKTAVAPTPTQMPSPVPTPTLPPDAQIVLLGPPPTAVLPAALPISFYWTWPLPLGSDQQFGIYWLINGQETRLGAVNEPNLGDSYTFQHIFNDNIGDGFWQVWLESTSSMQRIAGSSERPLVVQPGD